MLYLLAIVVYKELSGVAREGPLLTAATTIIVTKDLFLIYRSGLRGCVQSLFTVGYT